LPEQTNKYTFHDSSKKVENKPRRKFKITAITGKTICFLSDIVTVGAIRNAIE
jgi:hypothetical protein